MAEDGSWAFGVKQTNVSRLDFVARLALGYLMTMGVVTRGLLQRFARPGQVVIVFDDQGLISSSDYGVSGLEWVVAVAVEDSPFLSSVDRTAVVQLVSQLELREALRAEGSAIAARERSLTVMFMDIQRFSQLCQELGIERLVGLLCKAELALLRGTWKQDTYGTEIIVSDSVVCATRGDFLYRPLGLVQTSGRDPIRNHELLSFQQDLQRMC
eukprot:m51a1_g6209 hypothetical protein (213) ;mRNA; r:151872-153678